MFSLRDKKIFVAGHNGMVGSALCRRFQNEDCEVLIANRTDLDLRHQAEVSDWMAEHKPDAVILAAAHVGGIIANRDEPADFLYNNLAIESNVIHSAYKTRVEKLLFLGSSCIYPREAAQPITEEALLTGALEETNEAYAIAKIVGIKLCQSYRKQYGCNFISVMPCNLYGPGDYFNETRSHVIPAMIMKFHKAKLEGESRIELWGTGTPLREFLYVDDLADALVFLLQRYEEAPHINVGSGKEVTIKELAHLIAGVTGYEGDIVFNSDMPDGTPRKVMDNRRLSQMGWEPVTTLENGLNAAYDAYLSRSVRKYVA